MPTISRKRRAQTQPEASPPPQRRRSSPPESDHSSIASHSGSEEDDATISLSTSIKKFIRLALSSEYSRTPLRRADISTKCLPPNSGRQFKATLDAANEQLRVVFGMELTPLPSREKVTVAAKRAAARNTQTQSTSQAAGAGGGNATYILTTTLSPRYRHPTILPPAQIPSSSAEGAYTGFLTFILSLIYLSPMQSLSESRLEKHLKRVNADEYVLAPGERRENVLKRMMREGYIVKVRERENGGEESVDFVVGPRGKVEVGEWGVAGMVRRVYGKMGLEREELERRVVRSLGEGVRERKGGRREEDGEEEDGEEEDGEEEDGEEGEGGEGGQGEGEVEEERTRRSGRGRPVGNSRQSATRQSRRRGREEENDEADEEDEEEGDEDEE